MSASVKTAVGLALAAVMGGILLVFVLGGFRTGFSSVRQETDGPKDGMFQGSEALELLKDRKPPVISAVDGKATAGDGVSISRFLQGVMDADGKQITDPGHIRIRSKQVGENGIFYAENPGIYYINIVVSDDYGLETTRRITVLVNEKRKGETA